MKALIIPLTEHNPFLVAFGDYVLNVFPIKIN